MPVTYLMAPYEEPRVINETAEVEDPTIRGVLVLLATKYGANIEKYVADLSTGRIRQGVLATVNNRDIRGLNGVATKLQEGDRVMFLPPIAGG